MIKKYSSTKSKWKRNFFKTLTKFDKVSSKIFLKHFKKLSKNLFKISSNLGSFSKIFKNNSKILFHNLLKKTFPKINKNLTLHFSSQNPQNTPSRETLSKNYSKFLEKFLSKIHSKKIVWKFFIFSTKRTQDPWKFQKFRLENIRFVLDEERGKNTTIIVNKAHS